MECVRQGTEHQTVGKKEQSEEQQQQQRAMESEIALTEDHFSLGQRGLVQSEVGLGKLGYVRALVGNDGAGGDGDRDAAAPRRAARAGT